MALPITMSDAERAAMQAYLDELGRWNRRVNLTRVPDSQWWPRHIDESVELNGVIGDDTLATLADIGTGGGIPGIPLAVLRPTTSVLLVEGDVRKAGFLTHVAGVLALANVTVIAERAEVVGRDPRWRDACDVTVSRATAAVPALCEFCLPLLRPGGRMYAMVADANSDAELARHASDRIGGDAPEVVAPGLVMIRKRTPTPDTYPRRTGVPTRQPLT